MATVKEMKAAARSRAGKGAARAERRAGRVPGVIYGDGKPPLNVSVDHAELKQRIYAGHFLTTVYDLDVVKREEFEAVKEMARLAREENEDLKARVAALEARLGPGRTP